MAAPVSAQTSSVAGKASQTPVIPQRPDRKNAMGMMSTMPLNREMMWAGTACSVEVKKMDRMILSPAAGMPVKYSLSPYSAISCSLRLFSLLNLSLIHI